MTQLVRAIGTCINIFRKLFAYLSLKTALTVVYSKISRWKFSLEDKDEDCFQYSLENEDFENFKE